MSFLAEPAYAHGTPARTAILLINLGTPEAPTRAAVRRYLKEFLSDPRVVEIPRPLWWLILNGVILNLRPAKSAAKYAQIWDRDGSPLRLHTERQTKLLRGYLGAQGHAGLVVDFAMRYGSPSIASVLARLKQQRCERILVLPLYPQYAASTTATALDAVSDYFRRTRNIPELRMVRHFHDHPAYIAALAESVRKHWAQHGKPDKLLMSFHGLPRYTLERGDPYHCECQKTARLLAEALALTPQQYQLSFQSRFGRAEWLQPYTAATLAQWGKARPAPRRCDLPGLRRRLPGNTGRNRHGGQGRIPQRGRQRIPHHPLPQRKRCLDPGSGANRPRAYGRLGRARRGCGRTRALARARQGAGRTGLAQDSAPGAKSPGRARRPQA